MSPPAAAAVGVLAVAVRDGRTLLVKRRFPPHAGHWGFPGGRLELGETLAQAATRELREETGVEAAAGPVLTAFDLIDRDDAGRIRFHYVLVALAMRWGSGEPVAADDAEAADWFPLDGLPAPLCPDVGALAGLAGRVNAPGSS